MKTFDFIIIGGGRASNLAVTLGKAGKKVALIEKSKLGGTCPNRGCVPSKLLIGYAHVARTIKESQRHFINASINSIDLQKIFDETNAYISKIDPSYESRFNDNVTIYRGKGSFVSDHVIKINDEAITAPKIVIATGTRPKNAAHPKAWTSDDIFPLKEKIPKSITIVGSGFIACELANFFDAVGITTKLLVRSGRILGNEDSGISAIYKEEVSKTLDIDFDTTIEEIKHDADGFTLTLKNAQTNTHSTHQSEALLYATGRNPNTNTLALENTTIQTNDKGFIQRDAFFETTAKGVYVVGDAAGEHMLQHAAAYEVNYLGKYFLGEVHEPLHFKYMPHAVFTDPEIASVGLTEQKATEANINFVTSTTNWLASAKAMSTRLSYPRTKFLIDPDTHKILGCHMIGPESSTMMHQVLAIMHVENDIRHLKEMLYIHPALSEALLPAAVMAIKKVENSS